MRSYRTFVLATVVFGAAPAAAQVAPSASYHPGASSGSGEPSVSPIGGYGAAVPLDLPSPRGPLPVPLSIVYTGLTRAGAAGAGWDVPLSYVAWQQPQRNRPRADGNGEMPRRLLMSLGGKPQRMVQQGGPVYVP